MNRVSEDYLTFEFDGDNAYVKRESVSLVKDVDAAIFDCDGVLIDIRDSYDKAVSETVAFILRKFTGYPFAKDMIDEETIFLFRKSGGFNNDWDICYGVLMFILYILPEDLQEILGKAASNITSNEKAFDRLLLLEKRVKEKNIADMLNETVVRDLIKELKDFTDNLDESGVLSVDKNLQRSFCGSGRKYYDDLKHLLYYPAKVGQSVIPTVFEEIFCGAGLLTEVYGVKPVFYDGSGLIENEQVIVKPETLSRLSSILGKENLGIASGSRFQTARHVLGDVLSNFNSNGLVFLDDVEREEKRIMKTTGRAVNLKKPNSFSLLKASAGLRPFKGVLCVGDSMEDAFMVEEVRREDPRFMFAGVYRYSSSKKALLQSFLKARVDAILSSVNEIPFFLEELRRGTRS